MKLFRFLTVTAILISVPALLLAGVEGSDHDLTGTGEKLCFACHIPHNALGDNLWASTPGTGFGNQADLCVTCHDGVIATTGVTTVFDQAKEQHKMVGGDCSGDGRCHDVHNQNPTGTGRFLDAAVVLTNNSYCETCHDATQYPGAEGLGDHTAGISHFTNGTTFTCNQCHAAHGATAQGANPGGLTNPILLADNKTSAGSHYGAFCISCHNGTAPDPATVGSGGQAASDVFNYSEAIADGSEAMHPTITTGGGTPVGGCNKCHEVHDPAGTASGYILLADNTDSAYCVSCHGAAGAPPVGSNTHYTGLPSDTNMNNGLSPALPWANQVDDDGVVGADWAGASANNMVCETCHSVHRLGYTTTPGYFLRDNNTNNEICQACHTGN